MKRPYETAWRQYLEESQLNEISERPFRGKIDLGLGGKTAKINDMYNNNRYFVVKFDDKPFEMLVTEGDNAVQFTKYVQVLGSESDTYNTYQVFGLEWISWNSSKHIIRLNGRIDQPGVKRDRAENGTNASLTSFFKQKAEEWLAANPVQKPKPEPSRPYQGGTDFK